MSPMHSFHDAHKGAAIAVRITPRSRKDEIAGILSDGTVKIRITAPPVDGKANQALIKFLSKILDVTEKEIDIIAGIKGKNKIISILDMDVSTLNQKILDAINNKKS